MIFVASAINSLRGFFYCDFMNEVEDYFWVFPTISGCNLSARRYPFMMAKFFRMFLLFSFLKLHAACKRSAYFPRYRISVSATASITIYRFSVFNGCKFFYGSIHSYCMQFSGVRDNGQRPYNDNK